MTSRTSGRVEGKVVLVTGAGSGIGRAAAHSLADEGASVIVTDINEVSAQRTAREIGQAARALPHDTSKAADWARVLADVRETFGALHGLVNNAGIIGLETPSTIESEHLESWRQVHAVNTDGVFLGCKEVLPLMRDSGGGSIVNISSIAGLSGTSTMLAYGASKGAVRQFSKSVAVYCAHMGYNIRCNSVHPGIIMTPMGEGLFKTPEEKHAMLSMIPLGDFGTAEDIAAGILYLIADESRYVTGSELVIDGGVRAQ